MNKLALGIASLAIMAGCAKYNIQTDSKEYKNIEGLIISKTENSVNADTLIYGIRINTPQGTFDHYDKNLYDSTKIGTKVILDCKINYKTSTPRKNKSNCNTKYLTITNNYENIRCKKNE